MYDSIVADLNASRCTRLNVYNPCDTVNISRIAGQWERTSGLKFLYKEITCNTAVHKSNSENIEPLLLLLLGSENFEDRYYDMTD